MNHVRPIGRAQCDLCRLTGEGRVAITPAGGRTDLQACASCLRGAALVAIGEEQSTDRGNEPVNEGGR